MNAERRFRRRLSTPAGIWCWRSNSGSEELERARGCDHGAQRVDRRFLRGRCARARAGRAALAPQLAAAGAAPLGETGAPGRWPDADWRDSYKAHFHAWQFGRLHWVPVRGARETFSPPPGDAVLWLDPGLAFGTGNHETTRLCVERLVALAASDPASLPRSYAGHGKLRVIDAGCGSGILALS